MNDEAQRMVQIKGKLLSFDKVNVNGSVFSKDCKISYPGKVPIIWEFEPTIQNVLGNAKIIKEDGLYFDGELVNRDIIKVIQEDSANLGVGGYYTDVKRNANGDITNANLRYISITSAPVSSDYKFEVIESEDRYAANDISCTCKQ